MFKRRPWASWCGLTVLGIGISLIAEENTVIPVFLVLCGLCLFFVIGRLFNLNILCKTRRRIFISALVLCLSIVYCSVYYSMVFKLPENIFGKEYRLNCVVKNVNADNGKYADLKVLSSNEAVPEGLRFRAYSDDFGTIEPGNEIICSVRLFALDDNRKYLRADKIEATGITEIEEITSQKTYFIYDIRKYLNGCVDKAFGDEANEARALTKALILGDRTEIDGFVYAGFLRAGTVHLLSISGLHISILLMSVYAILKRLRINMYSRGIACICFGLFYTMLIGFEPSVTRAYIMSSAVILSGITFFKSDQFTNLFTTLALICLLNPYALMSIGLMLSFLACFAIMTASQIMKKYTKQSLTLKSIVTELFVMPSVFAVYALVFAIPISVFALETIPIVAPLSNLVILFVSNYLLIAMFIFVLVAAVYLPAASFCSGIIVWMTDVLIKLNEIFANFDLSVLSSHLPYIRVAMVISILTIVSALLFRNKVRGIVVGVGVTLCCISIFSSYIIFRADVKESVIAEYSFNNGNQIFIALDKESVMIDLGGKKLQTELVYDNGYTDIDTYVATTCNEITYERLERYIGVFDISKIYLPATCVEKYSKYYNLTVELCKTHKSKLVLYGQSIYIKAGEADIRLYCDYTQQADNVYTVAVGYSGNVLAILGNQFFCPIEEIPDITCLALTKHYYNGTLKRDISGDKIEKLFVLGNLNYEKQNSFLFTKINYEETVTLSDSERCRFRLSKDGTVTAE